MAKATSRPKPRREPAEPQQRSVPRLPWLVLALVVLTGTLLFWPTTRAGLFLDDYFHVALLEGCSRLPDAGPFSLYTFADGRANRMGPIQGDFLPWWTADDLRIRFWRPLSCLSYVLDHELYGTGARGYHVTNLVLWGLLLAGVVLLYHELATISGRGALTVLLAGAFFALDDAHVFTVLWIANRHALLGAALLALAIRHYHRFRARGRLRDFVSMLLLFVLGLLSSELAITFAGWVVAYELCLGTGGWARRLRAAGPVLAASLAYLVWYRLAGYGTAGSAEYISSLADPTAFSLAALKRVPMLLLGALTPVAAESWPTVTGLAGGQAAWVVGGLAVAAGLLLTPLLRRDPVARFVGLGVLVSAAAQASVAAENRHLLLPTLGTAWLLAEYVSDVVRAQASTRRRAAEPGTLDVKARRARPTVVGLWLATVVSLAIVVVHGVLAPVGALATTKRMAAYSRFMRHNALSGDMPADGEAADARVLLLKTAGDIVSPYYLPWIRLVEGHPWPGGIWTLAVAPGDRRLTRTGPRSFRLEVPPPGYLATSWERVFRSDFELPIGTRFRRGALDVRVSKVLGDHIIEIEATLDRSLDDPSVWLLAWDGRKWARVQAGPVGRPRLMSRGWRY